MPTPRKRRLVLGLLVSSLTLAVAGTAGYLVWSSSVGKMWIKSTFKNPIGPTGELDARTAINFFDLNRIGNKFIYDPLAYLIPKPNQTSNWDWPEHPAGRFRIVTNDLGLREDASVTPDKRGPRILVAGDSHTGGLVNNSETFANQLEVTLAAAEGWKDVDVVNAGVPFTGPSCYLGILKKYLYLKPDVFIAVLFTGNDFVDDLRLRYVLDGWSLPRAGGKYREQLRTATEQHPAGLYQGFNQAVRWKHFPREMERSLEVVVQSYRNIQTLCTENGITFLAVVLPTKMDVDSDDMEAREAIREVLGMTPEDVGLNRQLGDRFAETVRAAGIHCFDPTDVMAAHEEPLYWTQDYHLGLAGHTLLARELFEVLSQ